MQASKQGGSRTSGVSEHLRAAAEHGLEPGVLSGEGAQRGVVQRAAHVQLHVLAVRGQWLETVRDGARLETRGLSDLQGRRLGRRRARGLGGHAWWWRRAATLGSLRAPWPLQRPRDLSPRTGPVASTPLGRRYSATLAFGPIAPVPPGSRASTCAGASRPRPRVRGAWLRSMRSSLGPLAG